MDDVQEWLLEHWNASIYAGIITDNLLGELTKDYDI